VHRFLVSSVRARSAVFALATAVAGTLAVAPVVHASETIWVSPAGADTANGSSGAPLRTLGAAVAKARSGDRIVLRGGTYHESVRIDDTTLDITSAPGERAVFDGASPLTSFTRDGDDWAAALTTDFAVRTTAPVLASNPVAGHPDQVFLDGAPLTEVLGRDQVVPGTFFHDVAAGRVYLGSDPTGHVVEASDLPWAFYFDDADGSTLTNVTVRRYATPADDMAAVRAYSDDMTIRGLISELNAYSGLSVIGRHVSVSWSVLRDNGYIGMHAHQADDITLYRSEIIANNRERFDPKHSASGVKITSSDGITLRDNLVRANGGPGLWIDLTAAHAAIVGNLVQDNTRSGIQVELSGQVVVADNVATDNGESGVWVLESNDVEVWHNHLGHNLRDLWIEDGPRTSPDATADATWDLLRVRAVGNVFADGNGTEALLNVDDWTENRGATAMKVSSDANAFWLPPSSSTRTLARWARWPDPLAISATLDEHRYSSRNDLASTWSTAATDPYARDASALDFRAPAGAPVGLPLVDTVARALALEPGAVLPVGPVQSSDRRGTTERLADESAPRGAVRLATRTGAPGLPATGVPLATLLDMRANGSTVDGTYDRIGTWPAGSTFTLQVTGRAGVPRGARYVVIGLGGMESSGSGFLTAYPCGHRRPDAATMSIRPGAADLVLAVVALPANGTMCLHTTVATQMVVQVSGYSAG
jgi:hypothetical protein